MPTKMVRVEVYRWRCLRLGIRWRSSPGCSATIAPRSARKCGATSSSPPRLGPVSALRADAGSADIVERFLDACAHARSCELNEYESPHSPQTTTLGVTRTATAAKHTGRYEQHIPAGIITSMLAHEKDLLLIDEAAAEARLHPQTIRRRIKAGDLEALRLGPRGRLRVTRRALRVARPPEIRPTGLRVLPARGVGREEDDAGEEAAAHTGAGDPEAAGGGAVAGRGQAGAGGGEGA